MTEIAMWKLPECVAADSTKLIDHRIQHYRFLMKHFLIDGTRIIPTIPTVKNIFEAYENFNIQLAISTCSFTYFNDHTFSNVPLELLD